MVSEQSLIAQSSCIQFRWTTESDLDAVLRLEQDAENRPFILDVLNAFHLRTG